MPMDASCALSEAPRTGCHAFPGSIYRGDGGERFFGEVDGERVELTDSANPATDYLAIAAIDGRRPLTIIWRLSDGMGWNDVPQVFRQEALAAMLGGCGVMVAASNYNQVGSIRERLLDDLALGLLPIGDMSHA